MKRLERCQIDDVGCLVLVSSSAIMLLLLNSGGRFWRRNAILQHRIIAKGIASLDYFIRNMTTLRLKAELD
jgi:hypothetical protein